MINLITTRQFSLEDQKEYEEHLNEIEKLILKYQSSIWEGFTYVSDDTYRTCLQYLEILNKNSPLLKNTKEVIFIDDLNDTTRAILNDKIPEDVSELVFMLTPQGLNMTLVYEYGELKEAKTFGRSLGVVDITDKIIRVLGDRNDLLDEIPFIKVSGVLALPYSNLSVVQELCNTQDTYTGVFALLNENMIEDSDEIYELLHFICTDIEIEDMPFESRRLKLEFAETLGLTIAESRELEIEGNLLNTIDNAVYLFDTEFSDYDYKTEGIQIILEDSPFILMIMIGKWNSPNLRGIVKEIKWVDKKEKKIPVLILEEGVPINSETLITEIPLKSINLLLILEVEIGGYIQFCYLGEIGIVPITKSNELLFIA